MSGQTKSFDIERLDDVRCRIRRRGAMRTDGLIFADEPLLEELEPQALQQIANVAHLPGIVGCSIAMPDVHWGYGFPIGGVAAFDRDEGVISPGGVGYDINCGVRLHVSDLSFDDVADRVEALADRLFERIPSGVGSSRSDLQLSDRELDRVLEEGAAWMVEHGYGVEEDLEAIESHGCLPDARPEEVSKRAHSRGNDQVGTLGSGNHFAELGCVEECFDDELCAALDLLPGRVTVMIHSGSRGLGHQVCDDFLDLMVEASRDHGIELPDKQLCCAPLGSAEADAYWGAMNAAANFAFANRQMMGHQARLVFDEVLGGEAGADLRLVYDVCHNIAKLETHRVDGEERTVCVHRKGATRAFPPAHEELVGRYREIGQPVLVPGDMGRYSFVLAGTEGAFDESFGSCCHGAGRRMSRRAAKKRARPRNLPQELAEKGIVVRAASRATVDEEMPDAYKDARQVVEVAHRAGLGKKVAMLRPLAVVKG